MVSNISMTVQQVKEARRRAWQGQNVRRTAAEMGLSYGPVYCAVTGKTWASIQNPPPVPAKTVRENVRRPQRTCQNCQRPYRKGGTTTRCSACYAYWRRRGVERAPDLVRGHHYRTRLSKREVDGLYREYLSGKSLAALAEDLPLSDETLARRFAEAGYPCRASAEYKMKLTPALVRQARRLAYVEGMPVNLIAERFGQKYQTVYAAVRGHTWQAAGGPLPAAATEKQPCAVCQILTDHPSGVCAFCRPRGASLQAEVEL